METAINKYLPEYEEVTLSTLETKLVGLRGDKFKNKIFRSISYWVTDNKPHFNSK